LTNTTYIRLLKGEITFAIHMMHIGPISLSSYPIVAFQIMKL